MTQEEAIFRLGKWLGSDDCDASREYLRMLSEQAAGTNVYHFSSGGTTGVAEWAVKQTHAIIEMLEV